MDPSFGDGVHGFQPIFFNGALANLGSLDGWAAPEVLK